MWKKQLFTSLCFYNANNILNEELCKHAIKTFSCKGKGKCSSKENYNVKLKHITENYYHANI